MVVISGAIGFTSFTCNTYTVHVSWSEEPLTTSQSFIKLFSSPPTLPFFLPSSLALFPPFLSSLPLFSSLLPLSPLYLLPLSLPLLSLLSLTFVYDNILVMVTFFLKKPLRCWTKSLKCSRDSADLLPGTGRAEGLKGGEARGLLPLEG